METQFITDHTGKKMAVILPIREYVRIMEELDDIRLYDEAKKDKDKDLSVAALRRIKTNY